MFLMFPFVELRAEADVTSELRVDERFQLSPRLIEFKLTSPSLAHSTPVRVLLPQNVEAGRRYPVLYLLHGGVGNYRDWIRGGQVDRLTMDLPLIVVMPDGGRIGWYTDWFNHGEGGQPQWETYHIEQLIPWIDAMFPTVATREGRAIAGLSMGGFGAMSYAARHPDIFIAAAAFSGFVDIGNPKFAFQLQSLIHFQRTDIDDVFGRFPDHAARWHARNPVDLAENLRNMTIVLRTGNGLMGPDNPRPDILEIGVYPTMKSMQARLEELNIEHVWEDYGRAGHNFAHWRRSLEKTLPTFMKTFSRPPPRPQVVTYVSGEPEFTVFGWHVQRRDARMELATLKNANPQGFELCGTRDAVVTTPAKMLPPHAEIVATFLSSGKTLASHTLAVDQDGKLVVQVSLGPADEVVQAPGNVTVAFEKTSPDSETPEPNPAREKP